MTDDRTTLDGDTGTAPRRLRRLDGLADIDEVLRQLSNLLCVPLGCRRRSCRETERCAGGAGPPCVYEEWTVFVAHFEAKTRDMRRFWARQRLLAEQISAGEGDALRLSGHKERLSRTGKAAPHSDDRKRGRAPLPGGRGPTRGGAASGEREAASPASPHSLQSLLRRGRDPHPRPSPVRERGPRERGEGRRLLQPSPSVILVRVPDVRSGPPGEAPS
jgi:hypothetical protein